MRTTLTLDPDVEDLLRKALRERGASMKEVVNQTLRNALSSSEAAPFQTPVFSMGEPVVSIDKALTAASDLEDEELRRKLEQRK